MPGAAGGVPTIWIAGRASASVFLPSQRGIKTTRSAWHLAQREGVEMPILEQMYKVLYEDKPCDEAVHDLLTRDQKGEDVLLFIDNISIEAIPLPKNE